MIRVITIVAAMACGIGMADASRAEAKSYGYYVKSYEVQVEYWFFDTDYYYWGTVFSTKDLGDAQFVYGALLDAKANGNVNTAAPNSYWRYFAVDVRLITKWTFISTQPRYSALQNYSGSFYRSP